MKRRNRALVAAIALGANLPTSKAAKALEAIQNAVQTSVVEGGQVTIVNFGVFRQKKVPAIHGRDFNAGKPMIFPAHVIPAFYPSKKFTRGMEVLAQA